MNRKLRGRKRTRSVSVNSRAPQRNFAQRSVTPAPYGLSQGRVGRTPQYVSGGGMNELVFTNREFIMDIGASNIFTNLSIVINVGNSTLFPLLSQIALNFDQYEFYGLQFHYRSVTADNVLSSATQLGTVMFAVNYNANALPFTTKQQFMEYDNAVSGKISQDVRLNCDVSKRNSADTVLYTGNGIPPFGEDNKTFNIGTLNIGINGSSNIGEIGELWVSYSVRLMKPKLYTGIANNLEVIYVVAKGTALTTNLFGSLSQNDVYLSNASYKVVLNGTSLPTTSNGMINNMYIWTNSDKVLLIRFPDFLANKSYQIEFTGCKTTADSGMLTTGAAVAISNNVAFIPQLYDNGKADFFAGITTVGKTYKCITTIVVKEGAATFLNGTSIIINPGGTQGVSNGTYVQITLPTTFSMVGTSSNCSLKITQIPNRLQDIGLQLSTLSA